MFCRVEQQPDDRRRQTGTADQPCILESLLAGRTQLFERARQRAIGFGNDLAQCGRRLTRGTFPVEERALCIRERLFPRIGQQTIECASEVTHVEADGCGAARAEPDMLGGHHPGQQVEVLPHLQQGVHGRHQQRRITVDGSTQPHFGFLGHAMTSFPASA